MSELLRQKLATLRHRSLLVSTGEALSLVLIALPIGLTLDMLLDFRFELPWIARAAWLLVLVAIAVGIAVLHLGGPLLHPPDDEDLALRVERRTPALATRLIASIQLSTLQTTSASLVQALVAQTEQLVTPLDFKAMIPTQHLRSFTIAASLILLMGCGAMTFAGGSGIALLQRALLVPGIEVPRRTRVELMIADPLTIGIGDPVELRARAVGAVPAEGSVSIDYGGDNPVEALPLSPLSGHPAEFAATIASPSRSFSYRILLNDGHSAQAHVKVAVRPAVTSLTLTQEFPRYTHLKPRVRTADDLQLLMGSQLDVKLASNKPLRDAKSRAIFHCPSGDITVPLKATAQAAESAAPVKVPADATGFSIELTDMDGLTSQNPIKYPINMLIDQPPVITVTAPLRKEQLSTAIAKLIIGVEAKDDIALGEVRLLYRIIPPSPDPAMIDPDARATGMIQLALPPEGTELRGRFPFGLTSLRPRPVEGASVEWWLEAVDTNDVTGPGKASSEHYLSHIVSPAAVRADLYQQLTQHMAELSQTADTQKKDNAELGAVIQQLSK